MARGKKEHEDNNLTKAEQNRQEREARMAEIRKRGGQAMKPPQSKRKKKKIIGTVVGVLVALVLIFYILWLMGIPQRNMKAMEVNGQKVTVNEYDFYYNLIANQYNQMLGQGGGVLNKKDSSKAVTGEDISWGEFFHREAVKNLVNDVVTYQEALEKGKTITDEDRKNVDIMVESMQQQVGKPLDFELYLQGMYGRSMNVKAYKDLMARQYMAMHYAASVPDTIEISEDEINKYYDENKDTLDMVTYHSFTLKTPLTVKEGEDALLDEEKAKRVDETETLAKDIVEKLKADDNMDALAQEHNKDQKIKDFYAKDGDQTLQENRADSQISNKEVKTWLYDAERKAGDAAYFKNGNDFEIVRFESRAKDERQVTDVMISTFVKTPEMKEGEEQREKDNEKIMKTAKALVKQFTSEEAVNTYDETEAQAGVPKAQKAVKIESLTPVKAASLPPEILDFALSDKAKAGQAELIDTDQAVYVVTVLTNKDKASWYVQAEEKVQMQTYQDQHAEKVDPANNEVSKSYPGFLLVG